jgi:hypothetical protein
MAKQVLLLMAVLCVSIATGIQATEVPLDFPTIQAAIDASQNGDSIIVAPGEYHERLNFNAHNVLLASQYIISGDTSIISQTIIDGDSLGAAVTFENGENDPAAIIGFTITRGAAIEGAGIKCTNGSSPRIEANKITENYADINGAGIYCIDNSNPQIKSNLFSENIASSGEYGFGGGAVSCRYCSPLISGNEIFGNIAGSGGGILCDNSNAEILNNNIHNNTLGSEYAYNMGGAIACFNSSQAIIRNNNISNNVSPGFGYGGGISLNHSEGLVDGNVIEGNSADIGGGIKISEGSMTVISNNIIRDNYASGGGGIDCLLSFPTIIKNRITDNSSTGPAGIQLYHGGGLIVNNIIARNENIEFYGAAGLDIGGHINVAIFNNTIYGNVGGSYGGFKGFSYQDSSYIINNIIWGNVPNQFTISVPSLLEVKHNDIQGGYEGEGNIDLDPLFRDTTNSDFHLQSIACGDPNDSPLIDLGDPGISDDLLDCIHGLGTNLSDMGAYGGGFNYVAGDANGNGAANGIDVVYMVNYLKFGTNPPRAYYCPHTGYVYAGADANGNCAFNGLDVTYMVNFLKGGGMGLSSCVDCPAGGLSR